jgi:acyl transferase domain-containing protein
MYGSFLGVDQSRLDGAHFGIPFLEARSVDPQQRLVLHVGYGALTRGLLWLAEIHPQKRRNALVYSCVGVSVGVEVSGLRGSGELAAFSTTGGALSITSGRLSHSLGLVGPCYSIDVACASALVALHVCGLMVSIGECRDAIGAGTKVLSEEANVATSIAGMTSPLG